MNLSLAGSRGLKAYPCPYLGRAQVVPCREEEHWDLEEPLVWVVPEQGERHAPGASFLVRDWGSLVPGPSAVREAFPEGVPGPVVVVEPRARFPEPDLLVVAPAELRSAFAADKELCAVPVGDRPAVALDRCGMAPE